MCSGSIPIIPTAGRMRRPLPASRRDISSRTHSSSRAGSIILPPKPVSALLSHPADRLAQSLFRRFGRFYALPKKKMDKGLKVFLWIVGSLVGIFLIGFAAYGVYTAVDGGLPTAPESAQSSSLPPDSSDAPSSRPNDSNSPPRRAIPVSIPTCPASSWRTSRRTVC